MLSPLHPEQAVAFFLSLIGLCRFLCLLISQSVRASDDVHQAVIFFLQIFCNPLNSVTCVRFHLKGS